MPSESRLIALRWGVEYDHIIKFVVIEAKQRFYDVGNFIKFLIKAWYQAKFENYLETYLYLVNPTSQYVETYDTLKLPKNRYIPIRWTEEHDHIMHGMITEAHFRHYKPGSFVKFLITSWYQARFENNNLHYLQLATINPEYLMREEISVPKTEINQKNNVQTSNNTDIEKKHSRTKMLQLAKTGIS